MVKRDEAPSTKRTPGRKKKEETVVEPELDEQPDEEDESVVTTPSRQLRKRGEKITVPEPTNKSHSKSSRRKTFDDEPDSSTPVKIARRGAQKTTGPRRNETENEVDNLAETLEASEIGSDSGTVESSEEGQTLKKKTTKGRIQRPAASAATTSLTTTTVRGTSENTKKSPGRRKRVAEVKEEEPVEGDDAETIFNDTPIKENSSERELIERMAQETDTRVNDIFRECFCSMDFSRDRNRLLEILKPLYKKTLDANVEKKGVLHKLFESFERRFDLLKIEGSSDTNTWERWKRVYRLISSLAISRKTDNDLQFLYFLAEYCSKRCGVVEDARIRQGCCFLVGALFEAEAKENDKDNDSIFWTTHRSLYKLMRDRQCDKVPEVRAAVISAMKYIQNKEIPSNFTEAMERSPKDIIRMGMQDDSHLCRLAALQSIVLTEIDRGSEQLEGIIDIALSDNNTKVRKAAIARLGSLSHTNFSSTQLNDLLRSTLTDCDSSVREAGKHKMLGEWLQMLTKVEGEKTRPLAHTVPIFLRDLSFYDEITRSADNFSASTIMYAAFDVIRRRSNIDGSSDRCKLRSFVSEMLSEKTDPPNMISVANYTTIINLKLPPPQLAAMCFFWRSMIEYCYFHAVDDADKGDCLARLAPPITNIIDHMLQRLLVQPIVLLGPNKEDIKESYFFKQVAIRDLLMIIRYLDRDAVGVKRWYEMLKILLCTYNVSKEILDIICNQMVDIFFITDDSLTDLMRFIHDIVDRANEKKDQKDKIVNSEFLDGEHMHNFQLESWDIGTGTTSLQYLTKLLHSLLQTGVSKIYEERYSAFTKSLVQNILDKGTMGDHLIRFYAIKSMGILCMLYPELAKQRIVLIHTSLEKEPRDNCLCALVESLTDIYVSYGMDTVLSWIQENMYGGEVYPYVDTLTRFVTEVRSDSSLSEQACASAAKLMLASPNHNEHFLIMNTTLLMKLCHPTSDKNTFLKACLVQYFHLACKLFRDSQVLLVESFHKLIAMRRAALNEDGEQFVDRVDLDRVASFVAYNTMKPEERNDTDESVQVKFLRDILTFLSEHPEDDFVRLYIQTANLLDLYDVPVDELITMQIDFNELIPMYSQDLGRGSRTVAELRKLVRQMTTVIKRLQAPDGEEDEDEIEELDDVDDEERLDVVNDLPSTVQSTPARRGAAKITTPRLSARGRRKAPLSANRRTPLAEADRIDEFISASSVDEDITLPTKAEEPSSAVRPVLRRTAKSKRFVERTKSSAYRN